VLCTEKLLKIKFKLILILFTSFVEYVFFFFLVVQNIIGNTIFYSNFYLENLMGMCVLLVEV
jgi:hypothetical protein